MKTQKHSFDLFIQPVFHRIPALFDLIVSIAVVPLSVVSLFLQLYLLLTEMVGFKSISKGQVLFTRENKEELYHVVITGASSGVGKELAKNYAKPDTRLSLIARNVEQLKIISEDALALGASAVEIYSIDVTDTEKLEKLVVDIDVKNPISLIIVNAGINWSTIKNASKGNKIDFVDCIKPIVKTNFLGAVSSFHPLISRFIERRSGQIAIISSLAGLVGYPASPTYCSGKLGLARLGKLLRPILSKYGVKINVICPGFVSTEMNTNYPKTKSDISSIVPTDQAARWIKEGLDRDNDVIIFPFSSYLLLNIINALPSRISLYLFEKSMKNMGETSLS